MLPFLHDRSQKLERLIEQSSNTLAKYNSHELDLASALTSFLDETVAAYRAFGRTDVENELLALKAQYVSAQRGTHPVTLERVTSHRREMERSIALRVLQQSAQRLRADFEQAQQALADGRTQLRPIVLQGIHKRLIHLPRRAVMTQQQFDLMWRALLRDPEIGIAARQLAMQINLIDIQLVLDELIAAIRHHLKPVRRRRKKKPPGERFDC